MHTLFNISCHNELMETLGQRLKRLRENAGFNQVEAAVALEIEIDRSHLSKIENDKALPSWPLMCAFSDLYNVSTDYIRFGDDIPSFQTSEQVAKDPAELMILRSWRLMSVDEKRAFSLFADRFSRGDQTKGRVA